VWHDILNARPGEADFFIVMEMWQKEDFFFCDGKTDASISA
jgi:hypothetical protein